MNHSQKQTPHTSKGNNNDRSTIHKYSTFLNYHPAVLSNIIYNMSLTPSQSVTNNAIRTLTQSTDGESISGFKPLVQIIELKNNKKRCDMNVIISDGQYYIQAIVLDDGITENNIIRIDDYWMDTEDGMPICNILSYHIIDTNIMETIGSPVNICSLLIQLERERDSLESQLETERKSSCLLTLILEERIIEELNDINAQEERLTEEEERLKKKKQSLQALIEEIPESASHARDRLTNIVSSTATTTTISSNVSSSPATAANCVICQVAASSQAIIPCGHYCLCDDCVTILTIVPFESKKCPLCRKRIQSCLKIYQSKSS